MKSNYLFGGILLCSLVGTMVSSGKVKTLLLAVSGMLAGYGLLRVWSFS